MRIDLNADLGEGFGVWRLGDDEGLLDVVTSANIACGFHGGDPLIMQRTCAAAARRGVAIGAQVSYRDLAGFGRRRMDVGFDDLVADVLYQVGALQACARAAGVAVRYVKAHGALYNTAADDATQAAAVVRGAALAGDLPVLGLPGSALASAAAAAGLRFVAEGFADRAYAEDGRLVDRSQPGAVQHDRSAVLAQARALAASVESLCVHGDTPGAVNLATGVRDALIADGHQLSSFC